MVVWGPLDLRLLERKWIQAQRLIVKAAGLSWKMTLTLEAPCAEQGYRLTLNENTVSERLGGRHRGVCCGTQCRRQADNVRSMPWANICGSWTTAIMGRTERAAVCVWLKCAESPWDEEGGCCAAAGKPGAPRHAQGGGLPAPPQGSASPAPAAASPQLLRAGTAG